MKKSAILAHLLVLLLFGETSASASASAKKEGKKSLSKSKFLVGRVPPGRFEYPALNGLYTPKKAVKVCESDPACGSFTFKGTSKVPGLEFETYFFHFVPSEWFALNGTIEQYFHWTSYRVRSRNYAVVKGYKLKANKDPDNGACLDERLLFLTPLSPIHHSYICVCLTHGTGRIFTTISLFYLFRNKSPASRITQSHWERERVHAVGYPSR